MDALRASVLADELGETGVAELVTVAPARSSSWSTRVIAVTRAFRHAPVHERVLLVLPVGRSPPRGAILEATVRVAEPRPEEDGFDERAWLARQGIHVVLEASSWRERRAARRDRRLRRRPSRPDRARRRARHATASRRGIVLGVVLGEDEGLPADVQDDFRASGLYHLLAVSGQNVAFLAGGIYALGWLLRLSKAVREVSILLVIAAYVLAVGWQPSVVRAGVAGALASLAWLVARPADRWHFLAVGALVLMAWMPTSAARARLPALVRRGRGDLRRGAARAAAARRLSAPARRCGRARRRARVRRRDGADRALPLRPGTGRTRCSRTSSPSLAAPLVLGLGLLAAVVDPVSPSAAAGLAALRGLGRRLARARRARRRRPAARTDRRDGRHSGSPWRSLVVWLRRPRGDGRIRTSRAAPWRGRALVGVAVVVATAWVVHSAGARMDRAPTGLRVTFLDVGQGDAVLLETPRARVLVDQGRPRRTSPDSSPRWGSARSPRSCSRIRSAITSAARRPSSAGLDVAQVLDPGLAATGPESEEALERRTGTRRPDPRRSTGATFRAGGSSSVRSGRPTRATPSEDPNLNAVVLLASYGETDVFLPADAESDVTARLPLRAGRDPQGRAPRLRGPGPRERAPRAPAARRGHLVRPRQRVRPSAAGDARRARRLAGSHRLPHRRRTAASSSSRTADG